ncbi:hypothetical protein [Brevibacillus migulae]|uniref:hypothetical protein n=1 Tax=Brevibacillus migulae TaxID=1644114 RepID=UPI00106EF77E|nr:hypothetical protein [Brevibacillus migulae]
MRPIRRLNRYYRENAGFQKWVRANEAWFRENPEVFQQLVKNPNMLSMFMDLMVLNATRIQRKLQRSGRRR